MSAYMKSVTDAAGNKLGLTSADRVPAPLRQRIEQLRGGMAARRQQLIGQQARGRAAEAELGRAERAAEDAGVRVVGALGRRAQLPDVTPDDLSAARQSVSSGITEARNLAREIAEHAAALKGTQNGLNAQERAIVAEANRLTETLAEADQLAVAADRLLSETRVQDLVRTPDTTVGRYLDQGMPQTEEIQARIETLRKLVTRKADGSPNTGAANMARMQEIGELQALARLSQLMSGDVFVLLPAIEREGDRYDLRVQLVEADRVCDPLIRDAGKDILGGVEVGPHGEPVAYYVSSIHPGDRFARGMRLVSQQRWTRVPAFDPETGLPLVLHLMESERPGQRRGVPLLAPVVEKLKQLSRYSDAELMAAVVSGMFTAAITSERPQTPLGAALPEAQQVPTEDPDAYQLGNGAVLGLAPGEKLESVNPARPNAGFEPFVMAVCRQIGAGLGIPYELLIMQFTSSYSASRAALLEAWKRFHVGRAWLASQLCQPVYEAWLAEAVARGYVAAPGFFSDPLIRAAWCGAEWIGPTQGQLDPTKEVEAAAKRVAEGFSTRTRETRELTGGDWWAMNRLRGREEEARKGAGLGAPAPAAQSPTAPPAPQEEAA
jgi:lambda family phage portal protein